MLDMVARELGIPHPGGPRIEQMAKDGTEYINLPYVVKGMDLSFSGLYTAVRKRIRGKKFNQPPMTAENLLHSLQETAFGMLTEVTERALAHTEKKTVLLTGGVAANKRLQEMIASICREHNASFFPVPLRVAGDNGAMIAWTGIQQYQSKGAHTVGETKIRPKWRMDDVEIPWRDENSIERKQHQVESPISVQKYSWNEQDKEIMDSIRISGDAFRRGAEASLIKTLWFDRPALVKCRFPKSYRIPRLDLAIRKQRTLAESRALLDLAKTGFPVPSVYNVEPKEGLIWMQYIDGPRLKDIINSFNSGERIQVFTRIGQWVAKLHQQQLIHGDLTTSNILYTPAGQLYFIDFGLAQYDFSIEARAMELHLMKRVLMSTHGEYYPQIYPAFLQGYRTVFKDGANEIIDHIDAIELRGRYIAKDKRRK